MVRTQPLRIKNGDAPRPAQSMTIEEQLLAQTAVASVDGSTMCLTCVRRTD